MSELQGIYAHLDELRKRIIRIIIVVGIIVTFILAFRLETVITNGITLYYPTPDPFHNIAVQITSQMRDTLLPKDVQLIQTAPGQAFYAQFYVATLVSIVISIPMIVREMTAFIKPALSETEVHAIRTIAAPAIALFVSGMLFSYIVVIPPTLEFLYQYGSEISVIPFFTVIDFVTFVLHFLIAFGIAFQLPLIMYAATVSGLTDVKFWRNNIRYAIVVIVIIGAIITPDGTGFTMALVSGPMIGLYVIGMIILERRENEIKTLKSES